MLSIGYDHIPIKFDLQKHLIEQTWPTGFSLVSPGGDDSHDDENNDDTEAVSENFQSIASCQVPNLIQ